MGKTSFYVGIDVGKDELWVAVEGSKPRMFTHSVSGIRLLYQWVRRLSDGLEVHICMEATGVYSLSVAYQLDNYSDILISIINPVQIANYGKAQLRRSKTDRIDAQIILSFAQSQHPPLWSPDSEALRKLYHLVTQADLIREDLSRWNNRGHAQKYTPDVPNEVKKAQRAIRRSLKNQLAKIEQAIVQLCKNNKELREQVDLLCTIVGIAQLTAVRVLAYGRKALTERSRSQLTAHAGLAPRHHQSGTSIHGKSYIAKQGDKRLRKALFMPTLTAITHNSIIKQFYQRLLENGKSKMAAVVASMKKLLHIIRAMLIKKKAFNPQILTLT